MTVNILPQHGLLADLATETAAAQVDDTVADIASLVAMAGPAIQVGGPPPPDRYRRHQSITVSHTRPQVEHIRRKRHEEQTVKTAISTTVQELRVALARTNSVISPEIQTLISRLEGNLDTWSRLRQELHNDLNNYLEQVQIDLIRLQDPAVTGGTCQELGGMMSLLATMTPMTIAGMEQISPPPPLDAASITVEMQGPHVQVMIGSDKLMALARNLAGYKGGGSHYLRNVLRCTSRGGGRPLIESLIEQAMLTQEPQASVPDNVRSIQLSPRITNVIPVVEPAGADPTVFSGTAGDDEAAGRSAPVV